MYDFSYRKAFGGVLLVAGTAIGAGMLALPLVTAQGGFLPSILIYFLCYAFSMATGLLLLEICLCMPQGANIISMSQHLLGKTGKTAAWILYLFLFYTLTIAYIAGGAGFIASLFQGHIPHYIAAAIFVIFFGGVVYLGTHIVDRINSLLMIGLVLSFALFIVFGIRHVQWDLLSRSSLGAAFLGLPVIFTSFSYQGIVPSLTSYLNRDKSMVRFAIIVGSTIPFVAYLIWQFMILGVIPLAGLHGLLEAKKQGLNAIEPLAFVFKNSYIPLIGQFFGAFAITTSFLGVTLGLLDFLSDGLKIEKKGIKKLFLCALVFVPSFLVAVSNPTIFLRALGYAGGIGCALLLGLFPIMMVYVERYKKNYTPLNRVLPGGRILLSILTLFVVFELIIEVAQEII